MNYSTHSPSLRHLPWIVLLALGVTGCQALPSAAVLPTDAAPLMEGMGQPPAEVAEPQTNHCVVVLKGADDSTKRIKIDLEQETHVQDLLARSGAAKRYRRMEIQLIRTTPTGAKHRMGVDFDRSSRKVAMQSDYSVQHGDVLVVTEDPTTFIDDLLQRRGGSKQKSGIAGLLGM